MKNKFAIGCVLIALSVAVFSLEVQHKCEKDGDCNGDDYYCHQKVCERCVPCDIVLNRQPPEFGSCARSEDDCGPCLPGYQAEDLTNQRRSLKCFRVVEKELFNRPSSTKHIPWITVSIIVGLFLVAIIFTAFATYHYKKRQSRERELQTSTQSETAKMMDQRLPPPYEDVEEHGQLVGQARESACNFMVVEPDVMQPNQATPIGPYHHHQNADEEDSDESLPLGIDTDDHAVEMNGSTETIPSAWEPDVEPEEGALSLQPFIMCHHNPLVKSKSLDFPLCQTGSFLRISNSQSEPAMPTKWNSDTSTRRRDAHGETYRHRHVQLSRFRLPHVPTQPGTSSTLDCEMEPKAPESFTFNDDPHSDDPGHNHHIFNMLNSSLQSIPRSLMVQFLSTTPSTNQSDVGSQDSGYFGQEQSRRRPPSEMFEFEMTFFVKRRREFE